MTGGPHARVSSMSNRHDAGRVYRTPLVARTVFPRTASGGGSSLGIWMTSSFKFSTWDSFGTSETYRLERRSIAFGFTLR